MNITFLGAGAWGTALATSAVTFGGAERAVCLWARDAAQCAAMNRERVNRRYLPGVTLPEALQITDDLNTALAHARTGLYVVATPMSALADTLGHLPEEAHVVWLCKGFEARTGRLGHEVAKSMRPRARAGVLSGPSFAQEVAAGLPTALVAASDSEVLCQQVVEAFHSESLRIYSSQDPLGVEVGGAVKNVLAIATGIADGLALGHNARAALITRGLAEMTRLGVALGAQPTTFMGLSGLGDLVLTATGDLSRNRRVGLQLAQGKNLEQILRDLGHVSEGVYSAPTVLERAARLGVEMPITDSVVGVLQGRLSPRDALVALMSRQARAE